MRTARSRRRLARHRPFALVPPPFSEPFGGEAQPQATARGSAFGAKAQQPARAAAEAKPRERARDFAPRAYGGGEDDGFGGGDAVRTALRRALRGPQPKTLRPVFLRDAVR